MTRRALLILTARQPAVFSERAATEGQHRSLPAPTGAALLGWAAGGGGYDAIIEQERYTVFHSGRVRFSNALPLSPSGAVAYPVPQLLMKAKHGARETIESGEHKIERLIPEVVRVGRPEKKDLGKPQPQLEAIRGFFITPTGEVVRPLTASRLRTAVRLGRAAEGQLFGYTHIEPAGTLRYAATLEAEAGALSDAGWQTLLAAFQGKPLRLGRAAGSGYGGSYACTVIDDAGANIWPAGSIRPGVTRVRVWALSDLALLDDFGFSCFAPDALMLGLPDGAQFCPADSVIITRRYAPWNRHLNGRDLERQVIAAGSVLSFIIDPVQQPHAGAGCVGIWREAGLGRIWTAPMLLDGADGQPAPGSAPWLAQADTSAHESLADLRSRRVAAGDRQVQEAAEKAAQDHEVLRWLAAMDRFGAETEQTR